MASGSQIWAGVNAGRRSAGRGRRTPAAMRNPSRATGDAPGLQIF